MSNDPDRPTLPDVEWLAAEYKAVEGNMLWGHLHIVLEDYNVHTDDVDWCARRCVEEEDVMGMVLAHALVQMSRTQRMKLGGKNFPIYTYRGEVVDRRNDKWNNPDSFDLPR